MEALATDHAPVASDAALDDPGGSAGRGHGRCVRSVEDPGVDGHLLVSSGCHGPTMLGGARAPVENGRSAASEAIDDPRGA